MGDRVALGDEVLARARRTKELVGKAAGAGIGGTGENVLVCGLVQRVVEARDGARRIAEGRMRGQIVDALAVDVDLPAVAQAREVLLTGKRPPLGSNDILRLHAARTS